MKVHNISATWCGDACDGDDYMWGDGDGDIDDDDKIIWP